MATSKPHTAKGKRTHEHSITEVQILRRGIYTQARKADLLQRCPQTSRIPRSEAEARPGQEKATGSPLALRIDRHAAEAPAVTGWGVLFQSFSLEY